MYDGSDLYRREQGSGSGVCYQAAKAMYAMAKFRNHLDTQDNRFLFASFRTTYVSVVS